MTSRKHIYLWTLLFLGILALTQASSWIPFSSELSIWGFPLWLYYFIGVHLLLVGALYYFAKEGLRK